MSSFAQLSNEMLAHIPSLDILLAQKFVNRAWDDIRNSRQWSFLLANGWLFSPAPISTGTVAVTKFSQSVTLNTAASAAVTGLGIPLITLRQIRIAGGPIYSITAADYSTPTAVVFTLDRLYLETTNAAASYVISRIYYGPPLDATGAAVTDFLCFKKIYDPVSAYALSLNHTAAEVDTVDPQRANSGQPYEVVSRGYDSAGEPLFEFWPSPSFERGWLVLYQKRGVDLSGTDSPPPVIDDDLILQRALYLGAEWCEKQTDVKFRGINWRFVCAQHDVRFRELLRGAEITDEEMYNQNILQAQNANLFPFGDSIFLQSHAPWG